jgi:glucokinase
VKELYLGVDVGSTNTELALGDGDGLESDVRSVPTDEYWSPEELSELVEHTLDEEGVGTDEVQGIGVGIPGLIDVENQDMIYSSQMPEIDFSDLEEQLGIPVRIENDANVAVLGEYVYGDGSEYDNVATVIMGTGIGGGIIYDGQLLGSTEGGRNPEPGFSTVGEELRWHDACGGGEIPGYVGERMEEDGRAHMLDGEFTSEDLFRMAETNPVAEEQVEHLADLNGRGIANVVNMYAPELITFSGSVAVENPEYLEESCDRAEEYIVNPTPEMKVSDLEGELGVYGALALAARR